MLKRVCFIIKAAVFFYVCNCIISAQYNDSFAEGNSPYREIILEDFETAVYSNAQLVSDSDEIPAHISISSTFPAPSGNSLKCLEVAVKKKDVNFRIIPLRPVEISSRCASIHLWIFGNNTDTKLYLLLADVKSNEHFLKICDLRYRGWKRHSIMLSGKIEQYTGYDGISDKKSFIVVRGLEIRPAKNIDYKSDINYFFIDDISASVREKFLIIKDRW